MFLYKSRGSIDSWGPAGWTYLHTVTFAYPEHPTDENKVIMCRFLHAFAGVIPCMRCRIDFTHILNESIDPDCTTAHQNRFLQSRDALTRLLVDIHNTVNKKLNKKPVVYENVVKMYVTTSVDHVSLGAVATVVAIVLVCAYAFTSRRPRRNHDH